MKIIFLLFSFILLTGSSSSTFKKRTLHNHHAFIDCELDNKSLRAMPLIDIEFTRQNGSIYSVIGKLANTNMTRRAGFQRVCESTIEAMPIMFIFQYEIKPEFHMNNVVVPLDIAFIDKEGRMDSIQEMKPYSLLPNSHKPLYRSKRPILYALETHRGFFNKHKISLSSKMRWKKIDS